MAYNLFFFPSGSETATAVVRAEADDDSKLRTLYEEADNVLAECGDRASAARKCTDASDAASGFDHSECGRVVSEYDGIAGKERKERYIFCNEEDAIAAVLYGYRQLGFSEDSDYVRCGGKGDGVVIKGLTVTVDYKGDKYTNIEKVSMIDGKLGFCGIRFAAQKNGGEQDTYYLFTKTGLGSTQNYEGHIVVQSPSTGIVGENSKYRYAGNRLHFQSCDLKKSFSGEGVTYKDEDGNLISRLENLENWRKLEGDNVEHLFVNVAHLFFERNGEDFIFSVLKNGKLYKKISKTDEAVIFHNTSFDFAGMDAEHDAKWDIVFRKTNGLYVNAERFSGMNKFANSSIIMPQIPDGDELGATDYSEFYNKCLMALCKAFENSERYFTTKYQWSSAETSIEWSRTARENFATDTPPACQITFERIDNRTYTFSFEDAALTVSASLPCSDNFMKNFYVPLPDFDVDRIVFAEIDKTIAFGLDNGPMYVEITDAETGQVYNGTFELLRKEPNFDSTGIPSNLFLNNDWLTVKDNLVLYRKIKDAILKLGIEKCMEWFEQNPHNSHDEMVQMLYGEKGMVPDENVVSMALQLQNEYERTGRIPNIAVVGQAGTGKTTLAKNLGKIFGKEILECTPSDLRGAYLGHTKYEVVKRLADAIKENKILFIDEVYQLMDDRFGAEALTVLLPLMSGDQEKVEADLDRGQGHTTIEINFGDVKKGISGKVTEGDKVVLEFEPGVVPIWISGYENEVRVMINRNQGLYRRLEKIVIKTPATSALLEKFKGLLAEYAKGTGIMSQKAKALKTYFDEKDGEEKVKNFFGWGSQPQNSKYFANNAGVERFLSHCLDAIDLNKELGTQIEDIIGSTKRDIKRQLATVRSGGDRGGSDSLSAVADAKDTINVLTDIDTRFSDLVGCQSQIAFMQSIIEMFINKVVYEDFNLTVPKGALMEGLPGVGKTFIARAMAGELQERFQNEAADKRFGFIEFSASELGNKPASYIASIFSVAEEYDACILFIDEVDAIAKHRNENPFYDRYLELIRQMDGIEKQSNVFVLAATNAPENLDPAFVRSGRIDKRLEFILPDKDAREELARRAIRKRIKTLVNFDTKGKEEDIDVVAKWIAERTLGHTAGDIDNVINTAFIMYYQFVKYKNDSGMIDRNFFKSYPFIKEKRNGRLEIVVKNKDKNEQEIRDKELDVLMMFIAEEIERMQIGAPNYKKREETFSIEKNGNCSSVAIHEVGHAVVSIMLDAKLFEVITTLPRGDALGYVSHPELSLVTKSDYERRICTLMGGRIAEEIIYGKDNVSTGAVSDMRKATVLARKMVEAWGFSDRFGFMSLSTPAGRYLGDSIYYTCSEEFRENSDIAVNELLQRLYRETLGMLSDKGQLIENLAKCVFENETMTGEEFKELYEVKRKELYEVELQ